MDRNADPDPIRRARLARMKWTAHGLLAAMFVLYLVTGYYEDTHPALGYLRAFAEAGTVGALADWFAVTALFREPMGLPIPHTAIIKRRKDDIGETLADFIATHFLTREALGPRLERIDVAGVAADWLARDNNANRLTEDVIQILDRIVGGDDNASLRALVSDNLSSAVERVRVTPLLARVLELLVVNDPDDTLLTGLVTLAQNQFDENRGTLRETVGDRTPWWLPGFVDDRIYRKLVSEVEIALADEETDGDKRAREHLRRFLIDLIDALRNDASLVMRGEQLKQDLLQHPQLKRYLNTVTRDVSSFFAREVRDPDSAFRKRLADALAGMGAALAKEPNLRDEINTSLRDAAIYVLTRYRNRITQVISETIQGWDADTAADLIETRVGRDLQFIRINGTLVGGLAGLTLYSLWHAFF
ncbi:MAG: DUF445 domain-containing protein [Pseudomonadota bacterium]